MEPRRRPTSTRDAQLPVPDSHLEELRRRIAAADADGVLGQPWSEVRKRLGLEP
ncbi:MAG: addiction module protein [Myxococcales bacterium]|nr:addiction module protein [Myxococcales bacterium]